MMQEPATTPADLSPSELLQMQTNLDDELQSLQVTQLAAEQESTSGDERALQIRIKELERQLLIESSRVSLRDLSVKRLELGQTLLEEVTSEDGEPEKGEYKEEFVNISQEKLDLVQQIIRIEQETQELQNQLDEQTSETSKLREENQKLMEKLKAGKEGRELPPEISQNKEYKRLQSQLTVLRQSTTISCDIIQKLVVGLGIDLNKEKELSALVDECDDVL